MILENTGNCGFLFRCHLVLAGFIFVLTINQPAFGQVEPIFAPPPSHDIPMDVDSGLIGNDSERQATSWTRTIEVKRAKWLRLRFREVNLTKGRKISSKLKITSLEDGAFQILDSKSCEEWQNKTAYFNGNAIRVELLTHPRAIGNRVAIDMVTAGHQLNRSGTESICDGTDDRILSNDARVARTDSGCTAWLFDNRDNCMLTAGHCASSTTVVFFNVPVSDPDGSLNFPPPEDQYSVDPASVQFRNNGIGNDWCVFGCFDNSNTGLSPLQSQGTSFTIATPNSATFDPGDPIRVTGFGTTSSPVSPTFNQAQKTHVGPFDSFSGAILRYRPDTTGGNSGSPVIRDTSGIAYGIHTHAGCFNGGGANQGTGFNQINLAQALSNPLGICGQPSGPVNDNCQDALNISTGAFGFDTTFANSDGPALPSACEEGFGLSLVQDIWYRFTAPCSGAATFDFCASEYDTRVAAYTGDGGCPGSLITCNDDFCELQSRMQFVVVAGEDYIIRVGGFSSGGNGTMVVTCNPVGDCQVNIRLTNGRLLIDGTAGPDDISVTRIEETIEVEANGTCFEAYSLASINSIVINGYAGADNLSVRAPIRTTISGGSGPDDILGGTRFNEIFGGPGPDMIMGGPVADEINSGQGQDTVFGFGGNDVIFGGDASDMLYGGSGSDEIFGGLGGDIINGEGGNDFLVGNVGADTIDGGSGNDELIGYGGPDELFGGPGNDVFTGGQGYDRFDGGSGNDTAIDNGEVEISIENS